MDEEKKVKQLKRAASLMGKLSQIKHPRTKKFLSEIGKKGMAIRWGKK